LFNSVTSLTLRRTEKYCRQVDLPGFPLDGEARTTRPGASWRFFLDFKAAMLYKVPMNYILFCTLLQGGAGTFEKERNSATDCLTK